MLNSPSKIVFLKFFIHLILLPETSPPAPCSKAKTQIRIGEKAIKFNWNPALRRW
jgi:hypothetical protein